MRKIPKGRTYYMHTIDNRPATFDGDQVVFLHVKPHWLDRARPGVLATSKRQIEREQQATINHRLAYRMPVEPDDYGYVLVRLPEVR